MNKEQHQEFITRFVNKYRLWHKQGEYFESDMWYQVELFINGVIEQAIKELEKEFK